jgi:hypothetical protein
MHCLFVYLVPHRLAREKTTSLNTRISGIRHRRVVRSICGPLVSYWLSKWLWWAKKQVLSAAAQPVSLKRSRKIAVQASQLTGCRPSSLCGLLVGLGRWPKQHKLYMSVYRAILDMKHKRPGTGCSCTLYSKCILNMFKNLNKYIKHHSYILTWYMLMKLFQKKTDMFCALCKKINIWC